MADFYAKGKWNFTNAFRKKIYTSLQDLQRDVDRWLKYYNEDSPHSGKYCYGKTPKQTSLDGKHIAIEKNNQSMYINSISDNQNLTDNQNI